MIEADVFAALSQMMEAWPDREAGVSTAWARAVHTQADSWSVTDKKDPLTPVNVPFVSSSPTGEIGKSRADTPIHVGRT